MKRLVLMILATLGSAGCAPTPTAPQAEPSAKPSARPAPAAATPAPASAGVVVSDAWARATPPSAPVGGGYLTLENTADVPDRLLSVHSPASASVEIHEMRMDGDVMQMRKLDAGLPLPAHQRVQLKPGGYHLMFIAPHHPFVAHTTIEATLVFEHAAAVTTRLQVAALGGAAAAPDTPHRQHAH
jgi:periplasmic copper chaperone A